MKNVIPIREPLEKLQEKIQIKFFSLSEHYVFVDSFFAGRIKVIEGRFVVETHGYITPVHKSAAMEDLKKVILYHLKKRDDSIKIS